MATENIRQYTVSDAVIIKPTTEKKIKETVKSKWNIFAKGTAPSTAVARPMSNMNKNAKTTNENEKPVKKSKSDKNEIFVDIFEKLSVRNLA